MIGIHLYAELFYFFFNKISTDRSMHGFMILRCLCLCDEK